MALSVKRCYGIWRASTSIDKSTPSFLENVAAALVLFDPSNRQEPLKGVQFWLEQLKGKEQLPPAVLVGARVDRGAPAVSQQELEQFCQRYGIRGGYISTSARTVKGWKLSWKYLRTQIPWDDMTATVTTVTFKRIKDYVLALKEKPDRKGVLVSPLFCANNCRRLIRLALQRCRDDDSSGPSGNARLRRRSCAARPASNTSCSRPNCSLR